jgi:hypothetical protein
MPELQDRGLRAKVELTPRNTDALTLALGLLYVLADDEETTAQARDVVEKCNLVFPVFSLVREMAREGVLGAGDYPITLHTIFGHMLSHPEESLRPVTNDEIPF